MTGETSKSKTGAKKGKTKISKLKVTKETVKDLSTSELKKVRGGQFINTAPRYKTNP